MPPACPGMSPSGSKCLAGGRSRQAALQPPHTCCPEPESHSQWIGLCLHCATGHFLPYLGLQKRRPQGATSRGFRKASGRRTKGLLIGNLRATWIPQHGCCQRGAAQNRQDRHWTSSDDQVACSKRPPPPLNLRFPQQQSW